MFKQCNLKRDVYNEEAKFVNTVHIQDWLAVEVQTSDGSPVYETQSRESPDSLYTSLTENEWRAKTSMVRNAMVEKYIRFNFQPYIDGAGDDEEERKRRIAFCGREATRLIPHFEGPVMAFSWEVDEASDSYEEPDSAASGEWDFSVSDSEGQLNVAFVAEFLLFSPHNDSPETKKMRKDAYNWAKGPLLVNSFENARTRYIEAWNKADMNIACPPTDNMFAEPMLRAIVAAMNRAPSLTTDERGFVQTWRYSQENEALVARQDGRPIPPEQLSQLEGEFKSAHDAMVRAYVTKWFSGGQQRAGGTEYEGSEPAADFNPWDEAKRVVPRFDKWGLQVVPPSFKLFPKGKESALRQAYGLQPGEKGQLETRVDLLKKGVLVPIDILWAEDEDAKAMQEEASRSAAGANASKNQVMDGILEVVPRESYLRMRIDVFLAREKRDKEHKNALAGLKKLGLNDDELADRKSELIANYTKENRALVLKEDAELKQMLERDGAVLYEQENAALASLDDTAKVALLRSLYYLELRNFKTRRDQAVERDRQQRDQKSPIVFDSDVQQMDTGGDEAADNADFQYSSDARDEIHFAYLERIKSVLRGSPNSEALYAKELEMIIGRRKEAARDSFKELSMLTPAQRRDAAVKRLQAAKKPEKRASYVDLSFEEKMQRDSEQRSRIRATYEKNEGDKTVAQKLQTFDKYANMLTADALTYEAGRGRREEIYNAMYNELSQEVEGRENKRMFSKLMGYVLQQTLKKEWYEFLDARRTENMSQDEIRANDALREKRQRRRAYAALVREGNFAAARAMLDVELVNDISALEASKLEAQKQLIADFKDEYDRKHEASLFDRIQFGQDVMDSLIEVESEAAKKMQRSAKRIMLLKEKLRERSSTDVVVETTESVLEYGTPLGEMVQKVSALEGVRDIVDEDILTLRKNDEERSREKSEQSQNRATRNKTLEQMYKKLLQPVEEKNIDDVDAAVQEMETVDVKAEMDKIAEIDKLLAVSREAADYSASMGIKRAAVLLAFQKFVDSVQEYRSVNDSPTLTIESKERRPDPIQRREIADLKAQVLHPEFAAAISIENRERDAGILQQKDYAEMALRWREEQIERKWDWKTALDENDEEDRKDDEFINYGPIEYDYDQDELRTEAETNMKNLFDALSPANTNYDTWLEDVKHEFEQEQFENVTDRKPRQEPTLENLVEFVVLTRIAYSKGEGEYRPRKLTMFKGKGKTDHELSRLEPYRKLDPDGTWYIPYYDESNVEVKSKEEAGAASKITDVIHFYKDDLEGVPVKLRPAAKYGWKNSTRRDGETVDRLSYFKPWDGMDMNTDEAKSAQDAWEMAKKALDLCRKGFQIYDLVQKSGETSEAIFDKLKAWQKLGFFKLVDGNPENHTNNYMGYIIDVNFPDLYKKKRRDSADQQVSKSEAKKQWRQLWVFLLGDEPDEDGSQDEDLDEDGWQDEDLDGNDWQDEELDENGSQDEESEEEEPVEEEEESVVVDSDFSEEDIDAEDKEPAGNDDKADSDDGSNENRVDMETSDVEDNQSMDASSDSDDNLSGNKTNAVSYKMLASAETTPTREWWGREYSWWKR